ncbi:eukaryotic peptide chain release factor GTP-binding subunit ERF3A-like isoform X1 [Manis pentadactyla]|uniref:eukaryotic peptide chain release factor GTP-binding subunit ERF3A-like isoform X1 n=1 Tax=Manis pentadactyla TaxID=143292 RepID=UPI00255C55E2|nr:eukaryotic peptide chain release factor GTP-binding subunit ERF3A-like isoform X1 [Manis pentadactyla]XP_057343234.1 eukaryotic peptide chain release factor GTP-binding subunit ERF3A-like isoform X1 [Manis pentadactyla]
MELSEPVENGETEMSPEESWEHKEETSEAEPVGGSLGGGRPPEESAQEMMEEEEEIPEPKSVDALPGAPKKEHVNVVFMGHVDAGKSTIGGQIILHTSNNSYEDTHHSFQSGKAEWRGPDSRADTSGNTKDAPMNDPAHSSFVPPHKSK